MAIQNLQPLAYAVASVTFAIGLVTFFLRWYTRMLILQTWGWDDWISVAVFFCNIFQQVILYMFLHYGCGLHVSTLVPDQITSILTWLFIEQIFYYVFHFVVKSAFLFFYFRMSLDKTFRFFIWVGCGTNIAIFLINVFMAAFQCIPFDAIIHPAAHPNAVCINKTVILLLPSILNIFQDLYILILPIHTVWTLQMTTRRKIAVLSVLGFGASAVLVATLRLIPLLELNSSPDVSYVLGKMVIVAAVEIQLAIIAVNLPAMKALWTKYTGGSSAGESKGYKNGYGYKLGSVTDGKGGSGLKKSKLSKRGSLTVLERGTESEEELWRQHGGVGAIKVTRMVDVETSERKEGDSDVEGHKYLGGNGGV